MPPMRGLAHAITKTFNMLFPCTNSRSSCASSSDLAHIEEKLKSKSGELGRCLKSIENAFYMTMPPNDASQKDWETLKENFFRTTREIRGLVQKAIARIRDLQTVADFLSNPAEKDKKAKEIQIIADDLTLKSKQAGETIRNLRRVLRRLDEFWEKNGLGPQARPEVQQAYVALGNLKQALNDSQLDDALVDVLKSTSFPGTISSTVRLLPVDDAVSLHEMIDGKPTEAKIETIDEDDPLNQISIPLNQMNSLLNIWRIVLTDLKAVDRHQLEDKSQIMKYQAKFRVVMGVYGLYGRSLEAF